MASLGLKALLYGADKIPDHWFEKVPGGYYGSKKQKQDQIQGQAQAQNQEQRRRSRRYSEGRDQRNNRETSPDGQDGYATDARDGRRRSRRKNDEYDERGGGRGRAKSLGGERGGAYDPREDQGDNAAYAQTRGYNPADYPQAAYGEREDYYDGRQQQSHAASRYAPAGAAVGAAAGVAAASAPYQEQERPMSSGPAGGYVPYADIYSPQPQQRYPTNFANQSNVSVPYSQAYPPQDGGYPQSPHHQQYDQQPRHGRDDERGSGSDRSHDSDGGHRRRHRKRDSSRSRPKDRNSSRNRNASRPRGKSSIRDRFDTSEKGLGYGALGAVAGGLVGSELGKGIWPTLAGAVLGGLGTNAYESREKKKELGRYDSTGRSGRGDRSGGDSRRNSKRSSRQYDGNYSE